MHTLSVCAFLCLFPYVPSLHPNCSLTHTRLPIYSTDKGGTKSQNQKFMKGLNDTQLTMKPGGKRIIVLPPKQASVPETNHIEKTNTACLEADCVDSSRMCTGVEADNGCRG